MADKASNYATHKAMTREELRDSTKCVKIIRKDKDEEKIKPVVEIDKEKINEDLKYAGYNLMVTSELDMEPLQVYQTYDGSFINISRNQTVNEKLKKAAGLTNLDALFLSEKEIENLFQNCILPDF